MEKLTGLLDVLGGLSGDTKIIIGVVLFSCLLVKFCPANSK